MPGKCCGSLVVGVGALLLLACPGDTRQSLRPGGGDSGRARAEESGSHLLAYATDSTMHLDRSVLVELAESPEFNKKLDGIRKLPDSVQARIRTHLQRDRFDWTSRVALRLYLAFTGADPSPISGDGQAMLVGSGATATYGPHVELVVPMGLGQLKDADFPVGSFRWVASVFNKDITPYAPLQLDALMAGCIYVGRTNTAWTITPFLIPADTAVCKNIPLLLASQLTSLQPRQLSGFAMDPKTVDPSFTEADIPAAARWELSPSAGQVIGVRCASRWCQIGKIGIGMDEFERSPAAPASTDPEVKRANTLKGWYDSQVLAERTPQGTLRPSGVTGRVVPASKTNMSLAIEKQWFTVATIILAQRFPGAVVPQKYVDRGLGLGEQKLELCRGRFSECLAPGSEPPRCLYGSDRVFGRIVKANGASSPVFRICTIEGAAYTESIYATRWTWDASDEGLWIRCLNGCCQPRF